MRYIIVCLSLGLLVACTPVQTIPPEITAAVAKKPIEDLPVYASIEQQRCPKAKFSSYQKKAECTHAVRRELAARNMMKSPKQ